MSTLRNLALVALTAFISATHADILTLTPGTVVKNGVTIATSAHAKFNDISAELTTVGSGLRNKVVIVNIPVYVAQLMVADSSKYVKTAEGALNSLSQQSALALRLTFMRDVPADKISTSFMDGMDANAVNTKDTDVAGFMAMVKQAGDSSKGSSLNIFFKANGDGKYTVVYENVKGATSTPTAQVVAANFVHSLMSIWLGIPADSGLTALKAELLK